MPKGRVLMLTSSFPRWAGDSTAPFILHLAQDLQALGWQVDMLAPHAPGAKMDEILDGVRVHRFRYFWPEILETVCYQGGALINLRRNKWNLVKLPSLVLCEWISLIRHLKHNNYDVVHSHWILPQGFTAAIATRTRKLPHMLTVHGGDIFALQGRSLRMFKKFALTSADAVTVNSSVTRDAVRHLAPDTRQVHQIPMGVTAPPRTQSAELANLRTRHRHGNGPLLVFVGRLVEEKGVGDVIHAVSLLTSRLPDVTAVIIGDGQDRQRFESLANELNVSRRVFFAGWLQHDQVFAHLAAADMYVGPSKRALNGWVEAQGLSFVEAMLVRCPVIATRSGGIVDLVLDGETGLTVSEGAPKEIAAAVEKLVAKPELAQRLARNGYDLVRREYTREVTAAAFTSLYADLQSHAEQ